MELAVHEVEPGIDRAPVDGAKDLLLGWGPLSASGAQGLVEALKHQSVYYQLQLIKNGSCFADLFVLNNPRNGFKTRLLQNILNFGSTYKKPSTLVPQFDKFLITALRLIWKEPRFKLVVLPCR